MNISKVVWLLVLLYMVAEGVYAVDPSSTKEFNIGRAFAHCTKLTKGNYDLWFTGLISTIVGITGVNALKLVKQFLEHFEKNGAKDEAAIEAGLKALVKGSDYLFAPVRCVGGCWTVSLPYLAGSLSRLAPLGYYLEPGTEWTGSVESALGRGTDVRGTAVRGLRVAKRREPRVGNRC